MLFPLTPCRGSASGIYVHATAGNLRRSRTSGTYEGGVIRPDTALDLPEGARLRLTVELETAIDGQTVQVMYSRLHAGQLSDLFGGDAFTLARGMEANPLEFDIVFPEPRAITGLRAVSGAMDFDGTALLWGASDGEPTIYTREYRGLPSDPPVEVSFDRGPAVVERFRLEVLQAKVGPAEIHVRDLDLLP